MGAGVERVEIDEDAGADRQHGGGQRRQPANVRQRFGGLLDVGDIADEIEQDADQAGADAERDLLRKGEEADERSFGGTKGAATMN